MIELAEAEIGKRNSFQSLVFNSTLILAWLIGIIIVENKVVASIFAVSIGMFSRDAINNYLQYKEWKSLIESYKRFNNDIKAMSN